MSCRQGGKVCVCVYTYTHTHTRTHTHLATLPAWHPSTTQTLHTLTHEHTLMHVRRDSFMCGMTYLCVNVNDMIYTRPSCVTWLIYVWDGSFMCNMTHLCVWHESFLYVTWFIPMYDMTHSYMWHDSFLCVTWLTHLCTTHSMTRLCMDVHGWCTSTHKHTFTCTWMVYIHTQPYIHMYMDGCTRFVCGWCVREWMVYIHMYMDGVHVHYPRVHGLCVDVHVHVNGWCTSICAWMPWMYTIHM